MDVAQVCHRFFPTLGGIQVQVKWIGEYLRKRGFNVDVLTTDPTGKLPKEEMINGVRVLRFRSWAPNGTYYFSRELQKYLSENSSSYDVVHAHSYHDLPALYAAQAKKRNKFVFNPHYHGAGSGFFRNLLHVPYRYFGKKIFQKADKIICVSNFERGLVEKHFKINEKKLLVIPNGIDLKQFDDLSKQSKEGQAILSVSRLERYKGLESLIEVLPKLNDDVCLEIVGKGPLKKQLTNLVEKLNLNERVMFSQDLPRKTLLQKYVDADLFVLLSQHEAYSLSVAEALGAGTRCIVANASGLVEWVDNNSCHGIDLPVDLDLLAEKIQGNIGKQAEKSEIPSLDQTINALIEVYEEI